MDPTIILPGGFRFEGALIRDVELRELSGIEEDILTGKTTGAGARTSAQRMTEILSRCTVRVGQKSHPSNQEADRATPGPFQGFWSKAFAGDRGFATVQLRRLSLGDVYKFNEMCPACKTEIERVEADLSQLTVDPFFQNYREVTLAISEDATDDDIEALKRQDAQRVDAALMQDTHQVRTPGDNEVTYRLLTAADEDTIVQLHDGDHDSVLTHLLHLHIKEINGKPASARSVKLLPARDRRWLEHFFDTVEGGINTIIEIKCTVPKCSAVFKKKLNTSKSSFFFPSGT